MEEPEEWAEGRRVVEDFIVRAEDVGLPTAFLHQALEHAIVMEGPENRFDPASNRLELTERTVELLDQYFRGSAPLSSNAAMDVSHEATHALLDALADDPFWQPLIARTEAFYMYAPLEGGEQGDDQERLTQEAAAEYVGDRFKALLAAYENLTDLARNLDRTPVDVIQARLDRIRSTYAATLADLTHGYEDEGTILGQMGHTAATIVEVPPALREALDERILEGRVPATVDEFEPFQELLQQITSRLPTDPQ